MSYFKHANTRLCCDTKLTPAESGGGRLEAGCACTRCISDGSRCHGCRVLAVELLSPV